MTDKSIPLYSLLNQCGCFLFSRKGAGMKLFEAVKEAVTARNAAEYYGIKVGRNGIRCTYRLAWQGRILGINQRDRQRKQR